VISVSKQNENNLCYLELPFENKSLKLVDLYTGIKYPEKKGKN